MEKINWGIIGCGDVTELKSGPAFNKIKNSVLVAVMRRDGAKAQDYANRHGVSKWYDEAKLLINDPDINAIYIATPPSSHELYTLAAIEAGKAVYVEKPMTINYASAERMMVTAAKKNIKLSVAHYRREQPKFKKIKELLDQGAIGKVRLARLNFAQKPLTINDLNVPKTAWRVDPSVAGGGLFHDLSPHQLDLMIYFFGNPKSASGAASSQGNLYNADDLVAGFIRFENDVIFSGMWDFQSDANEEIDRCELIGTNGKIMFSIFDHQKFSLEKNGMIEEFSFDELEHVQQPMIEKVVEYFRDKCSNPCSALEGTKVMKIIDSFIFR